MRSWGGIWCLLTGLTRARCPHSISFTLCTRLSGTVPNVQTILGWQRMNKGFVPLAWNGFCLVHPPFTPLVTSCLLSELPLSWFQVAVILFCAEFLTGGSIRSSRGPSPLGCVSEPGAEELLYILNFYFLIL